MVAAGAFCKVKGHYMIFEAIRLANGVASIVVTRHGAQTSIPDREEVGDLIRNY